MANNDLSLMFDFTDDLILKIFKYVDIYHLFVEGSRVCSRWNKIAHHSFNVIRVIESETWRKCTEHLETFVLESKARHEVDRLLLALALRCRKLRKVDIKNQNVDFPDDVRTIFHCGSFLVELNLEGTNRINRHMVRDEPFTFFDGIAKLSRLRILNTNKCNWTDDGFVEALLQSDQRLEHLSIKSHTSSVYSVTKLVEKHASQLKDLTISGTLSDELLATISRLSTLQHLHLDEDDDYLRYLQVEFFYPAFSRTDIGWDSFGFQFRKLRHLSLSGHSCMRASVVGRVAAMCPGLETISIIDCNRVTENSIKEVVLKCIRLKKLELKGLDIDKSSVEKFVNSNRLPEMTVFIIE